MSLPSLRRHQHQSQSDSGGVPKLEWLFVAFFADGTIIEQRQEHEVEGSRMIAVTAKQKDSKLVAFELRHVDGDKTVTVDLITGTFIVNGIPLEAQSDFNFDNPKHFDPKQHDLSLAYWRSKRHNMVGTGTVQDDLSISVDYNAAGVYFDRYFIGWHTTVDGQRKQAILAVG